MNAQNDDSTLVRKVALRAGVLYLLIALIAPIGIIYVPSKLFIPANAVATAAAIQDSEWLLRLGMASELIHQAIEVFLSLVLYRLFKPVQEQWAKQMLVLCLIPIPIMFLNTVNEVGAVVVLGGYSFLSPFTAPQLDVLAYLFMRLHGAGITVATVFWGLWLLPLSALLFRARFGSRVVGVLAALAGTAYVVDALTKITLPQASQWASMLTTPAEAAELAVIAWLLYVGVRRSPNGVAAATGSAA